MTTFSLSFSGDAPSTLGGPGSKDGRGCADHDEAYRFGRRPRAIAPFPFTLSQYARLLALRGCVGDGLLGREDLERAGRALRSDQPGSDDEVSQRDAMAWAILEVAGVLDEHQRPTAA